MGEKRGDCQVQHSGTGITAKDPSFTAAADTQEGDAAFYLGLRRAVQARENGFTWIAAQTGLGRESLCSALSAEGNPSLRAIRKELYALGADGRIVAHTAEAA